MAQAAGLEKENSLRQAGFSNEEIDQWRAETAKTLTMSGFNSNEVDEYFGHKNPDMTPIKKVFEENLNPVAPAPPTDNNTQGLPGQVPVVGELTNQKEAKTFVESLEAGWQISVTGLLKNQQAPTTILPEDAPRFYRIASQISTLAGDVPAMLSGSLAGAIAAAPVAAATGPAAPIVDAAAAGYGAFALPAAIRKVLMDHYEKGDVQSFDDFWDRAAATFIEANKEGVIGAATAGVGGVVGKVAVKAGASAAVKTTAQLSSEVVTMVSVGNALHGQVPNPNDFVDAAILVGGLKGVGRVTAKMRDIYHKTGVKPQQIAEHAMRDPTVKTDLLKDGMEVPRAYESLVDKSVKPIEKLELKPAETLSEQNINLIKKEPAKVSIEPLPVEPKIEAKPDAPQAVKESRPVLDRIGSSEKAKKEITFDKVYTHVVDDLHPLKQFTNFLRGEKVLGVKDDPYALSRLTRGSYGKADQFINFSPFDFNTLKNTGSKPLKKILEPFEKDLDSVREYAIASRALELETRGIKTGVPIEGPNGAKEIVSKGKAKYQKAVDELTAFQNETLKYLNDSGILSKESYTKMSDANKSYVPFYRILDEGGGKNVGSGLVVKNPIKQIKGSDRKLIDPIESIVKNTHTYVALAERNRALVKMVELAESSAEGKALMQKQPTPMKPVEVKTEEVRKFFEEHGIEATPEAFTIFRPQRDTLAKDEIAVYRSGKREVYKVAPELAEAVKKLDRESVRLLTKLVAMPSQTLRAGSVLSPDFIARNLSRDMISAFNLSKGLFTPLDTLSGLKSLFKKDAAYEAWLKSGGANSTMVAIDRQYINSQILKLESQTGLMSKAWNVVKSPLEGLRVISELVENTNRLGEFKRVTKGDYSLESTLKGGLAAREITLDFQRMGASTRAMNMITAFWNAHVQGLDKTMRALKERPVETGLKLTASITMPSVLLWFNNKDDARWKEIPRWQKDLFWIVMTDEHIYRIPKPAELGLLFGSLPERILEAYYNENPKAFTDLSDSLLSAFTPSYIPTAFVPVIEHFANKSTFTGQSIVPAAVEKILPEYQYTDYTTEGAKALGKLMQVMPGGSSGDLPLSSPMVLENYIRAWSGNLGMYALRLADLALVKAGAVPDPVKPASTLADIPVIKAFVVRYPSATAQSIQDFYDRFEDNQKVVSTIKYLAKSGDFKNMEKELMLEENQDKLAVLTGIKDALTTQSQYIRMVAKNPDITPEEKRQLIDGVYLTMIQAAKAGNDLMIELDKELKK